MLQSKCFDSQVGRVDGKWTVLTFFFPVPLFDQFVLIKAEMATTALHAIKNQFYLCQQCICFFGEQEKEEILAIDFYMKRKIACKESLQNILFQCLPQLARRLVYLMTTLFKPITCCLVPETVGTRRKAVMFGRKSSSL